MLRILSERKQVLFYREHTGIVRSVLLEKGKNSGYLQGFSDNYIRVEVQADAEMVNEIIPLHLVKQNESGLMEAIFNM